MEVDSLPSGKRITLDGNSVAWAPCCIGEGTVTGSDCSIGALAHIGRNVTLGNGCRIQGSAYIADECQLLDGVFIGPNATVLNDKYPPSGNKKQWQPVTIGRHAVVGGGSTILPGCDMGEYSVLGAGSTLTKPLPKHEVWAGNPAVFMMSRKAYDEKQQHLKVNSAQESD